MGFDTYSVWNTLAWGLGVAAVVVLLWSLFWDRSRGRRRCPRCWYDMSGVPGLKCPECGRHARAERSLFKTRRRWRVACLIVPLLVGSWLLRCAPRIGRDGWKGAIPTTLLVVA